MTRARDIANFGDGIATADIDDGAVTAGKLNSTLDLTGKTVTLPTGAGWTTLESGSIGTSSGKATGLFPSGIEEIWISLWYISKNNNDTPYVLRLSDASNNPQSSGYYYQATSVSPAGSVATNYGENQGEFDLNQINVDASGEVTFDIFIRKSSADNRWTIQSTCFDLNSSGEGIDFAYGFVTLTSECNRVTLYPLGGSFDQGTYIARYR